MAVNSKREKIIENIETVVTALSTIKTVKRRQLSEEELKSISAQQLPFVGIVGKLPKPISNTVNAKQFRSLMDVQLFCYGLDNVTPDSTISSLADDLWRAIQADPNRGELAISTKILPDMPSGIFAPFVAFTMTVQIEYTHTNESI